MITNEEDRFLKSIARDWADLSGDAGRDRQNPTMSRIEATVTAVNSDGSLTVNTSSEDSPSLKTFKRTTACDGAKVGDRVIVDTLNHISYITGVLSSGNPHYVKRLWSGSGWYMNETQTATFSEPMSEQDHGIVFHWQAYTPGTGTQNYDHNYYFVPKTHAENEPGQGVMMLMASGSGFVRKYLYVSDGQATGHAVNDDSGASWGGVSLVNNRLVLVEVLGV